MADQPPSRVRPLFDWEIEQARKVFADQLQYERVRIHEGAWWPNAIDRLGRRLKGLQPAEVQNAVTLGNHCFFPVRLLDKPVLPDDQEHYKISWLIHELTHAWQYQHLGWRYLFRALRAQFRYKGKAYDFGDEQGLIIRRKEGWTLTQFNPEQQGDITRSYYDRVSKGLDVSAWTPYIDDLHKMI